ncbi:chromatin assembly factor 1 subunit A-like [Ixodes scapularis]|uniref:chromatin assembly factor 1 subunit A-like n=1 Tax=Ixodes scapularis TaxID=6945 RepID=UPI001A9D1600|nr:chromatin assembly factor 1 subunit A-like [Ixodes scapularis]
MVAGMFISFCNYFDATLINGAPYDSTGNDHNGGSYAGVLPVPEESDGTPQNSTQNSSTQPCIWSEGESKLLLALYSRYFPEIGPFKRFKTRKHMFIKIAEEINERMNSHYTAQQCDTRFKTLKKRKTKVVDSNGKSGATRQHIEFEEEFNLIRAADDSVEPEVMMGVSQAVYKQTTLHAPASSTENPRPSTSAECTTLKKPPCPRQNPERMRHMEHFFSKMEDLRKKKDEARACKEERREERRVERDLRREEREKKREDRAKQRQERHQNLLGMLERVLDTMNTAK